MVCSEWKYCGGSSVSIEILFPPAEKNNDKEMENRKTIEESQTFPVSNLSDFLKINNSNITRLISVVGLSGLNANLLLETTFFIFVPMSTFTLEGGQSNNINKTNR